MEKVSMKTLFLDLGGVLLTNGWDRHARERAAKQFSLDEKEMNSRHSIAFDTLEIGKMTLDDYLDKVVFYKKQPFSKKEFISFMYAQSQPFPEMIGLMKNLKKAHGLKFVAVSNEARELTDWRIKTFKLDSFIDIFVVSCFVKLRKPDSDIFKLALDLSSSGPSEVLYIEDRQIFVDVAKKMKIKAICHKDFDTTSFQIEKILNK